MRRSPSLCPVHEYERLECDTSCAWARRQLAKLSRDFRMYWYDRRRGVPAMDKREFASRQRKRAKLWQLWRAA